VKAPAPCGTPHSMSIPAYIILLLGVRRRLAASLILATILRVDAIFLGLAGLFGVVSDLLSYNSGSGPRIGPKRPSLMETRMGRRSDERISV